MDIYLVLKRYRHNNLEQTLMIRFNHTKKTILASGTTWKGIIADGSRRAIDYLLIRHTWMMYVPVQYKFLDLPDVASLNAPRPLMIMNAKRDHIVTEGWHNWSRPEAEKTVYNGEYENTGAGYKPIQRVEWSHQLTDDESKKYILTTILNGWNVNELIHPRKKK